MPTTRSSQTPEIAPAAGRAAVSHEPRRCRPMASGLRSAGIDTSIWSIRQRRQVLATTRRARRQSEQRRVFARRRVVRRRVGRSGLVRRGHDLHAADASDRVADQRASRRALRRTSSAPTASCSRRAATIGRSICGTSRRQARANALRPQRRRVRAGVFARRLGPGQRQRRRHGKDLERRRPASGSIRSASPRASSPPSRSVRTNMDRGRRRRSAGADVAAAFARASRKSIR